MTLDYVFSPGELLIPSWGSYSDKVTDYPLLCRVFFRVDEVLELYSEYSEKTAESHVDNEWWESEKTPKDFMTWLVKERYVEAVDNATKWHLGDNDFELEPNLPRRKKNI